MMFRDQQHAPLCTAAVDVLSRLCGVAQRVQPGRQPGVDPAGGPAGRAPRLHAAAERVCGARVRVVGAGAAGPGRCAGRGGHTRLCSGGARQPASSRCGRAPECIKATCPAAERALRGNLRSRSCGAAQGFLLCRAADARDSGLSDPHTPRRLRSGGYLLGFTASEDMSCIPPASEPQDVLPLLSGAVSPTRRARLDACGHGVGGFFQPCLSTTSDPLRSQQLRAAPPLRPWRSSAPELHLAVPDSGCLAAPAPPAPAPGAVPSPARTPRSHSPPPALLTELLDPHGRMRLAPHLTFGEVAAAAAAAARSAAAAVISAAQHEHASAAVRAALQPSSSPHLLAAWAQQRN